MLLDEANAGVDSKARREFWDQIRVPAADGLKDHVASHYMDEAERCNALARIACGKLLGRVTAAEMVSRSGLATWSVTGENVHALAAELRMLKRGQDRAWARRPVHRPHELGQG
jgi:ABC-2 type transport system ATP-binding protein